MVLCQLSDCKINIGLQCNNLKCKKIFDDTEWFFHCKLNSSKNEIHNGPYNYCHKCAKLKMNKLLKQNKFTILKEGWLLKKPLNELFNFNKLFNKNDNENFKKRYFKLSADWKLWYYIKPNDIFNKDMIDLNYMNTIKKKGQKAIEIYIQSPKQKKNWLLLASTTNERNEWYNIMLLAYQSKKQNDNDNDDNKENVYGNMDYD